MKKIIFALAALFALTAGSAGARKPVIFGIGDSTMATKDLTGLNPERGWGHVLPGFLSNDIDVCNLSANGRSTKSFIDEGIWQQVLDSIRPGDYLFIEFGHNDEKPDAKRHTEPKTTFRWNIAMFAQAALDRGATPVILNSIPRRNFVDGVLTDTHGDYRVAPREVADSMGVAFVDANTIIGDMIVEMGDSASAKLWMHVAPNTVPLIPKGRIDNTHLNVQGARAVCGLLIDAIAEKVPALKPYVRHYDFVVAPDGSGDFFTIQDAVDAVPVQRKNPTTIMVRPGVYKEKVIIPANKTNLRLIGYDGAVITNDDSARTLNRFGEELGTSGSATFYVYAPDFYAENITFENTTPADGGQAVAAFVGADRAVFNNCRFLGNQDTLYTWYPGRQYYKDCYIEGTVDFIFGCSTAVFDGCDIHAKRSGGYLTAPSTAKGAPGYLFVNCDLTADPGVENVWLSRPWRDYGEAVFANCRMGGHINPAGWHNWNKPEREKTARYAEYGNTGAGADTAKRVKWSRQLKDLKKHDAKAMLAGTDGWNPTETLGN